MSQPVFSPEPNFATTRWTVVLAAGGEQSRDADDALETLCRTYWVPVYAYIRRRVGDLHESQDITQAFFERLLEKQILAHANPERGRFRAFLLTACKHFLINEWEKQRAAKRGGGRRALSLDLAEGESRYALAAVDTRTAEHLFERQWALTLLARVLDQLRTECIEKGKHEHYDQLKQFLTGAPSPDAYAAAALALGLNANAVKVAAHRLRGRYRELLRAEISHTVATPGEVDEEIRELFSILGAQKTAPGL